MKKSKFLAILLAVMITLSSFSCLSVVSFAEVYEGGEFDEEGNLDEKQWEFDDETGVLTLVADVTGSLWTQYKDQIVKVVVTGDTDNVIDFGFSGCSNLTEVEFKVNLSSIGKGAFQDCDSLAKIELPIVGKIDDYAFYDCDALTEATINSGLLTTGKNIFKSCDALSKVTVVNGVTKIGEGMFEDCIALDEIILPDSIEDIGRLAFENCIALEEITIPDSTKTVGEYAFYGCTSVTSAYIGHNVSTVGEYAFGECAALENVVVKCAMPVISDGLFYGCSSLKGLTTLPEGIKTIGKNAFKDCTSFSEIILPATVTQIGDSAFDATIITKIDIPMGVESIGAGAFTNCNYLTAINVEAKNRFYASVDGVLYNADITELICCPAGKTGSVSVKEGTEIIGADAFIGCTGVEIIEIPDSVTEIATNAFNGCADGLKIKANCDSYAAEYAKLYAIDIEKTHSAISDWIITVNPTCDNAGVKEKQCVACGNVEETAIVDALGHNYNNGVVTLEPTCEADGVVTFTCQNTGCNASYTTVIPAIGHNYDNGTIVLEATCEADGVKRFRCQNSGCYAYYDVTLPATGHNLDDGTVMAEATCEADGVKVYKCSDEACNYKVTEVIPAIGHKYDKGVVTLEPTCENNGIKTYTCQNAGCENSYDDVIPAYGHKYDDGVITKYPTVNAEGVKTYTCKNESCKEDDAGHTYVVSIPNTAFDGILYTNAGAYADEYGNFCNLTWLITDAYHLYIYADDTAAEWAPYRDAIVTVTITGDATTVENGSFAYMKALKEANILLSLGTIEAYAFQYCENLETVVTGSISEIQNFAFYSCKSLVNLDIYGGLEEGKVGRNVFLDCTKLSNVILRNGCLEIGEAMFKGCTALEEIVLPESIVVIGDSAFDGTALKTIRIPTDVKEIQKGVFTKCTELEEIVVDSKNDNYFSFDGVLYDMSLGSLLLCPAGKIGEVEVWDGTTKIAEDAFIGCVNVTKVKVPASVKEIADNAFNGCSSALVIACDCDSYAAEFATGRGIATELNHTGSKVWQITKEATCTEDGSRELICSNCEYSYETETIVAIGHKYDKGVVTEEATCEADGEKLFTCQNGCGDTYTEVIPAIGHNYDEGVVTKAPTCENDGVKTFTCKNDSDHTYTEAIPAIGHNYDEGVVTKAPTCEVDGVKTFTCKNDCESTYTEAIPAIGHSYDAGVITKQPTLNKDGEKLFTCQNSGCGHTYTEAIPNVAFADILAINDGAYADENDEICNITWYLTKAGVLYVYADGTEAEWEDYKDYIKSAVIAKTVSTIGKNAFMNCTGLKDVTLAEGVKALEKNAFKGCLAIEDIVLPETLNKIGDSAFDGTSIKEIYIPADVDVIEKGAFTNCKKLTDIIVDDKNDNYFSVDGVLYDVALGSLIICPAGKNGTVEVKNGTKSIANDAFIGCKDVTKVSIPNSITAIADNAFNGCSDALVIACNCNSYAAEYAELRMIDTEITHVASDVWKVTAEPTCLKEGSKERVCSGCEYSYEKVTIAALNHEYTSSVTTKVTCEKDGVLTYKCTRTGCGDTYTEAIPAIGHKYNKGVVTLEATCEKDGVKTFTCQNADCDDEYTEAIPAIGHKYDKGVVTLEPTCEKEGVKTFTCTNAGCDDEYTEAIPAINHKYDKGVVTLEATCEKDGVKTFTCTNAGCDDEYTEAIPAIGHKYDKGVVTLEATCEIDGVKTFTCTNAGCGDEYTEAIPAIGHSYDAGVITKQPTLNKDGVKLFTCQNSGCGHTYTEAIPNVAFADILAINDGAYADENDEICNITWYLTKAGVLYVYADGTEAEWADYKTSIKSAVIAKTVKTIAKNAFANCTALEAVSLAEGVEVLGKNAFKGCKALTEIELPETLNTIGDTAFDGTSIKEIYIPADVDVIEKGAFTNCKKLTDIIVDDKNDNYFSVDGVLYDVALGSLIICPAGKSGTVKVKSGTKSIANDAFIGCKDVTTVSIPNSVTAIADNAFNGCSDALVIACNCDSAAAEYAELREIKTELTHAASDVWKVTAEPTCLKEGSKERVCSGCGYSQETKAIVALGHSYDNGSVTVKATCEKDGVLTYKCTRTDCEETYTEVISATGHKMDDGTVTKKATCEENGTIVYKCVNEGCKKTVTEVIKKLGHSMDKGTVVEAASCGKEGTRIYKCTNDGCTHEKKEAIPALTHKYTKTVVREGTCITKGLVEYKCKNCGDSYTKKPYGEHQLYSSAVRTEPTCDKAGKEGKLCALCHEYVGDVKVLPATGHTGEWVVNKEATVYSAGKKTKVCTDCGKTLKTATIAQLKCSKPNLKSAENTASGIKITWRTTKGADYYRVYRKVKGGEWKYLDSTSKTSFTDKTAKSGTKYYYAIRAKNEAGNSVLSSSISKYFLNDSTLNSATSSKNGVVLKWSKVTGAEAYAVYRKTASGSYKKVVTVNGTSYTDKSAKKGVKYTYKVKAVYSKTTSVFSNAKSVTDKY